MNFIIAIITFLYLLNCKVNAVVLTGSKIQWVSLPIDQFNIVLWHPDGYEGFLSIQSYLCRCIFKVTQYTGKLIYQPGQPPFCGYAYAGKESDEHNFEVLFAPKGSLSWQEFNGKLPENAIYAGLLVKSEHSYVCRGWVDDKKTILVTGYYTNNCYVAFWGEHILKEFEVLVKNEYGIRMNF